MAELLIKAVDANHSDPTKDTAGCYKIGDVVGVAPDGWNWGSQELKAPAAGGKFVVVKITDVTRAQVIAWTQNKWSSDPDSPQTSGLQPNGSPLVVKRRRIKIDVSLLPAGVRNTLNTTGQFSTTWTAIRQYIHDKLTDQTGVGSPIA